MEVAANANTSYDLNIRMDEHEVNRLLEEIELLFTRSIVDKTVMDYLQIVEFKNLLTLSINNTQ